MSYSNSIRASVFCLLFLTAAIFVPAAPGDLDPSFGNGGKVFASIGKQDLYGSTVAVQSDGKIVTAGFSKSVSSVDFALARFNADGSFDQSFDGDGKVTTNFGGTDEGVMAIAIQTDGKIVAVGYSYGSRQYIFALARYNSDGSLDTTFDGDGKVTIASDGISLFAYAMALQADGKIVVAGSGQNGSNYDFALARYNSNGALDATFGGDGIVFTDFTNSFNIATSVAIQVDGKIVAAGYTSYNSGATNFALARYNPDGSLDTTFDGDGKVTTGFSSTFNVARAVAIQADGKIVAAGSAVNNSTLIGSKFALARFNKDGSLDTTFDGDGKVITDFGNHYDQAYALAIQADGKIVAAGEGGYCESDDQGGYYCGNTNIDLARYNSDGSLDTGFSGDGKVTDDFGGRGGYAYGIAIKSNGRIVVAGTVYNPDSDFFLAQYQSNSKANFDFDGDGKADVSVFRPSNGTWYLNRSQAGFFATQFGISTDRIVPADYDGDGKTDVAVWRDGIWYLLRSSAGFTSVPFGSPGDIPAPADFDGDGKAELVVYRPSNGVWYSLNLTNNAFSAVQFGSPEDKPVAADFDGDGRADQAVYRPSNGVWYMLKSRDGFGAVQFGIATDKPLIGDYDGDGRADQAVYRPSTGTWYINRSSQGFTSTQFGVSTDMPAPADFDGDGKTDIAVFRPDSGNWYQMRSTLGFNAVQFGANGDKPVPNAFVP